MDSTLFPNTHPNQPHPQLTFHSLAGGKTRLPRGLQRPGDPPADAILLATHARRCNVHLLNRSNPKSLLYSIQVRVCGGAQYDDVRHPAWTKK